MNFEKEMKKSLHSVAREAIDAATGEVEIEALVEQALTHDYVSQLDGDVIKEAAVRNVIEQEVKRRSRYVSPDGDASDKTRALFPGEWDEHGISYDGKFVKNRHANRTHNVKRIQNVEENLERVTKACNVERERFAWLEIAYDSATEVQNNEEAKRWLIENEEVELNLK